MTYYIFVISNPHVDDPDCHHLIHGTIDSTQVARHYPIANTTLLVDHHHRFNSHSYFTTKQYNSLSFNRFGIVPLLSVNSIITTLNISYFDMEKRSFFNQLLVSIVMVIVFSLLLSACAVFVATSILYYRIGNLIGPNSGWYTYLVAVVKWLSFLR